MSNYIPSKHKKIKSKNYLILGAGSYGQDKKILSIFNQVAQKYSAEIIYIGPVSDVNLHKKSQKNVNSAMECLVSGTDLVKTLSESFPQITCLVPKNDPYTFLRSLTPNQLMEVYPALIPTDGDESDDLLDEMQNSLVSSKTPKNVKVVEEYYMLLSKFLGLSAIFPKGDKSTRSTIMKRVTQEFKNYAPNWIFPHPVPQANNEKKLDLNETYNQWNTGALTFPSLANKMTNLYKSDFLPSAVLILIDEETDEFHARHVHIEKAGNELFSVDDGLIFTSTSVFSAKGDDKATYSTDDHAPYYHKGVLGATRALNELHEPEWFVNGGDALVVEGANRHALKNGNRKSMENKRILHDIKALRYLLNIQGEYKSIKNRVMIDSNHLNWFEAYVDSHPELEGMIDLKSIHELYFKNDWRFILSEPGKMNYFYFKDILIRHGHQERGIQDGLAISETAKFQQGHGHSFISYKRSQQAGCGAEPDADYLGGNSTAWQTQNGVATAYKGKANMSLKLILHNNKKKTSKFAYRGDIYEVPFFDDKLPEFLKKNLIIHD